MFYYYNILLICKIKLQEVSTFVNQIYIMKARIYLFLVLVFLGISSVNSQEVKVFETYDSLEKELIKENDTLYVINFWATWCAPCVKELPYFETFTTENKAKKVKVILVSLDFEKQKDTKLLPFLQRKKITSEVVLLLEKNYNNWLPKVNENWSGSIPATLLVQGKKRKFEEREFESESELKNYINTFINQ